MSDIIKKALGGDGDKKREQSARSWWNYPTVKAGGQGQKLANVVQSAENQLATIQQVRIMAKIGSFHVYTGGPWFTSTRWMGIDEAKDFMDEDQNASADIPRENVLAAIVSTLKSKIASDPIKISVSVQGGSSRERRKGEKLDTVLEGLFNVTEAREAAVRSFVDSLVLDVGCVHVFDAGETGEDKSRVRVETIFPGQFIVDEYECVTNAGKPRQFYMERIYPREKLYADFPESEKWIDTIPRFVSERMGTPQWSDDCRLIEAWHAETAKGAGDGRHVLVADNVTLLDEDWGPKLPFAFYRWEPLSVGFYGVGLVQQLLPLQRAVNQTLDVIDYSLKVAGYPYLLSENSSEINVDHFSEGAGTNISYQGTKPEWNVPNPVCQQQIAMYNEYYSKMWELAGVAEDSATGETPDENVSGESQRVHQAIETLRFKAAVREFQKFHLDIASLLVDVCKEISQEDPSFDVQTSDGQFLKNVPWKEVDLPRDSFKMQMWPTSLFPSTPEGKLATAKDIISMGLMTGDQIVENLFDGTPDLKSFNSSAEAASKFAEWLVSEIVDEGILHAPAPEANLTLCLKLAVEARLNGIREGLQPDRLAKLGTLEKQILGLVAKANAEAQAQALAAAATAQVPSGVPTPATGQKPSPAIIPQSH